MISLHNNVYRSTLPSLLHTFDRVFYRLTFYCFCSSFYLHKGCSTMRNSCGSKPLFCLRQFYRFLHIVSTCLSLTEFGLNSDRRITRLSSPHGPAATSTSWATRVQDILFFVLLIHSYIHISMHSFIHIYINQSIHPSIHSSSHCVSHSDIFLCHMCVYIY